MIGSKFFLCDAFDDTESKLAGGLGLWHGLVCTSTLFPVSVLLVESIHVGAIEFTCLSLDDTLSGRMEFMSAFIK